MSDRAVEQAGAVAGTVLLTLCAGQFLMALDSSVMNVSIATVAEDLGTTITGIQSAIVLYTLVMAMLMITGGKIGSIIGRKRAFVIGLVIYCAGSLTTALAPNLAVLLFGWSLLEGIGAALIMPAIVALVAGNFPPEGRPRAYGLVGAAGAIAIAVGPLIGGLATTYASWRWVFAGEVLVGAGIFLFARRIADAPVEVRPQLDLLGSVLSAAGMGLVVIGVLQSAEWGWLLPSRGRPVGARHVAGVLADPRRAGVAPVVHAPHPATRGGGRGAARQPVAFGNRTDDRRAADVLLPVHGMMGMFFVVPLYLSVALGLSAIETGIKITPLSVTMLLAAAGVPRFFPTASPRRVVEVGFVAVLVGILVLLTAMDVDATREHRDGSAAVDRPGHGGLASQLGSVTVSAVPDEAERPRSAGCRTPPRSSARRSERRWPDRSSIAALTASFLTGIAENPDVPQRCQVRRTWSSRAASRSSRMPTSRRRCRRRGSVSRPPTRCWM